MKNPLDSLWGTVISGLVLTLILYNVVKFAMMQIETREPTGRPVLARYGTTIASSTRSVIANASDHAAT